MCGLEPKLSSSTSRTVLVVMNIFNALDPRLRFAYLHCNLYAKHSGIYALVNVSCSHRWRAPGESAPAPPHCRPPPGRSAPSSAPSPTWGWSLIVKGAVPLRHISYFRWTALQKCMNSFTEISAHS